MALTDRDIALLDALKAIARDLEDEVTMLSGQTVKRDRSPLRAAIIRLESILDR
jgi:hypothetical protein